MKYMSDREICEWGFYHGFKASIFQKIFWLFWPTRFSIKYNKYKNIEREDILTGPVWHQNLRNKEEVIETLKREPGRIELGENNVNNIKTEK